MQQLSAAVRLAGHRLVGDAHLQDVAIRTEGIGREAATKGTAIGYVVPDVPGRRTALVDDLRSITGFTGNVQHLPAREGEVSRSCLSAEQAASGLGWTAKTSLFQGLKETVDSFLAVTGEEATEGVLRAA